MSGIRAAPGAAAAQGPQSRRALAQTDAGWLGCPENGLQSRRHWRFGCPAILATGQLWCAALSSDGFRSLVAAEHRSRPRAAGLWAWTLRAYWVDRSTAHRPNAESVAWHSHIWAARVLLTPVNDGARCPFMVTVRIVHRWTGARPAPHSRPYTAPSSSRDARLAFSGRGRAGLGVSNAVWQKRHSRL